MLRRLADTSPHLLADIGLVPDQHACGRICLWVHAGNRRPLAAIKPAMAKSLPSRLTPPGRACAEFGPAPDQKGIAAE